MTMVYFDSSAFVKLVVDEEGSELAATLWDGCDAALASPLAYPEVCAALAAAGRDHRLTPAEQRTAEEAWVGFWEATRPVELTSAVSTHAGTLAKRYALRGADAVHLASAMTIGSSAILFAVWDDRLRAGARWAGVRVVPDK